MTNGTSGSILFLTLLFITSLVNAQLIHPETGFLFDDEDLFNDDLNDDLNDELNDSTNEDALHEETLKGKMEIEFDDKDTSDLNRLPSETH